MRRSLLFAFALIGCQHDIQTPFPPGLEPLDDDAEPLALDATPAETLRATSRSDDLVRAYGRADVFVAPAVVWAAVHDPQVLIARCATTTQTVSAADQPFEISFLVHYFVDDILNVEWDDEWRGATLDGDPEAPDRAFLKHQKVSGSDFIEVSEGTIELVATADPGQTELRFVEHLDAVSASAGDLLGGMQDTYDAIREAAHGRPAPSCR